MLAEPQPEFWEHLDALVAQCAVVIDRPRGSQHPRWETLVYPLDYGYLEGTSSADGGEVDVWVGYAHACRGGCRAHRRRPVQARR